MQQHSYLNEQRQMANTQANLFITWRLHLLLDLLIWTVRKTQAISRWVKRICFILDHLIWASLLVTAAVVMVTATLMVLLLTLFKALVVLISPSPTLSPGTIQMLPAIHHAKESL
jgi:hypothetical protein